MIINLSHEEFELLQSHIIKNRFDEDTQREVSQTDSYGNFWSVGPTLYVTHDSLSQDINHQYDNDRASILGALARGYTHDENAYKELDSALCEAMSEEVMEEIHRIIDESRTY